MKRAARAIRGNDIFAIKQVKEDQDEPLQEEVEYYQDSKGRLPLSPVDPELPEQCVVNLDNILTIPNARLAEQLGLGWRDLDLNLAKIFQET